jgi:hypothetical protein
MLFPSWLLVGLATLVSAANLTLSPFDIDISVANPVMRFAPIGPRTPDTQGQTNPDNEPTGAASVLTGGWELSYSDTDVPFENVTFTTLGVGTPKRSTNTSGATVTLDWVGTGIFFYGNTTDAAGFDVSVDGFPTNVNGTGGVLGGVTNLPFKQHQAVLTVTSGTLDLYSATITTALQTEG